jgi:hypothetical protein
MARNAKALAQTKKLNNGKALKEVKLLLNLQPLPPRRSPI